MATANPAAPRTDLVAPIKEWVLERGVLYALTQTPILAIIGGVFYHVLPYHFLVLTVFASLIGLPIWIAYRKSVSTNPDEPVHHLHKYALWALPAAGMFTVSRIPLHYTIGIIYWHPWYDFGTALTGGSLSDSTTLFVGGLLNLTQGWAMGTGFYILFKRHSLMNVMLYIAVWVSSLYSYDFATYSRVGMQSPPYWHASMAWAHFWMAMTLWFMPRLNRVTWPSLKFAGRSGVVGVGVALVLIPTVFAQYRSATWEAPLEVKLDNAAFNRVNLVTVPNSPTLLSTGTDAKYAFALRFGPRDYKNWFKQLRTLDASSIQVTGRLWQNGQIIAWCNARVDNLPTANDAVLPAGFAALVAKMKFTDIPVACTGPAAQAATLTQNSPVTVQWNAEMTLIGGREDVTRQYSGDQSLLMSFAPQVAGARGLDYRTP
jgi:hypothetical protein